MTMPVPVTIIIKLLGNERCSSSGYQQGADKPVKAKIPDQNPDEQKLDNEDGDTGSEDLLPQKPEFRDEKRPPTPDGAISCRPGVLGMGTLLIAML
jgi:hypothetical protein